jgi:acyl-CoA synthetase (AMP-forming)/AMP-acid ligase II
MRLHDVLDYQARERPTAEFAVQGNRRLTYREALREVHQQAHALVSAGLQIGDRVAILAKNRLESLLLYFAASKTGAVPVPLNYRLAPPEWAYILQDAQVKLLIAAEEYLPAIDGIRSEVRCVAHSIALTERPPGSYIHDRITDMIVSGGENVYPQKVEQVLFQHPAIADAAVIGVPDAQWGETVKAIVVVRPGMTATAEELIAFCRDQLGGFERPRSVDVVAELPRNPSGKVLKRVLREPYWTGHQRRVAGA